MSHGRAPCQQNNAELRAAKSAGNLSLGWRQHIRPAAAAAGHSAPATISLGDTSAHYPRPIARYPPLGRPEKIIGLLLPRCLDCASFGFSWRAGSARPRPFASGLTQPMTCYTGARAGQRQLGAPLRQASGSSSCSISRYHDLARPARQMIAHKCAAGQARARP